jgi:hypothetical protein
MKIKNDDITMRKVAEKIKDLPYKIYTLLDIGAADKHLKDLLPGNIMYYSLDYKDADFIIDLDKPIVSNKKFDIIVCLETLEHTIRPHSSIREIIKLSHSKTLFFLSMPNEYNFYLRLNFLIGKKTSVQKPFKIVENHLHIHSPRIEDIVNFFSEYIKIEEIYYFWYSRKSEHGNLITKSIFKLTDKFINKLSSVYPSLFARNTLVLGTVRRIKKEEKEKLDFLIGTIQSKFDVTYSRALKGGAFNHKFMLNCAKYAFTITTSVVWLCYKSLSLNQHGMSEI